MCLDNFEEWSASVEALKVANDKLRARNAFTRELIDAYRQAPPDQFQVDRSPLGGADEY
jgi:hypothetical protein